MWREGFQFLGKNYLARGKMGGVRRMLGLLLLCHGAFGIQYTPSATEITTDIPPASESPSEKTLSEVFIHLLGLSNSETKSHEAGFAVPLETTEQSQISVQTNISVDKTNKEESEPKKNTISIKASETVHVPSSSSLDSIKVTSVQPSSSAAVRDQPSDSGNISDEDVEPLSPLISTSEVSFSVIQSSMSSPSTVSSASPVETSALSLQSSSSISQTTISNSNPIVTTNELPEEELNSPVIEPIKSLLAYDNKQHFVQTIEPDTPTSTLPSIVMTSASYANIDHRMGLIDEDYPEDQDFRIGLP